MGTKKNYYAVKKGYDKVNDDIIENVIFDSWEIVKSKVTGFSKKSHGVSPEYKGFETYEEALRYLENPPFLLKADDNYNKEALHCYVDGSVKKDGSAYSHGVVIVKNKKVIDTIKGIGSNPEVLSQRQIGGELMGAMLAMRYAKEFNHNEIVIFFDYKGVACHALGSWRRNTKIAELYYDWVQNFMKSNENIKITFCKVDAHTGDEFNEIADGLAKSALGIKPDKISLDYASEYNVLPALDWE